MRNLYILLFTFLLGSCSVEKFCSSRYPPVTVDSTYTVHDTIPKWDTLRVPYKELVFDSAFTFIPPDVVFHQEKKKSGLTSRIDINKGKIKFTCAADSLMEVIKGYKEKETTYHQKKEVKWLPCEREHKTGFNAFATYWFWITICLILIAVIIKCFRG